MRLYLTFLFRFKVQYLQLDRLSCNPFLDNKSYCLKFSCLTCPSVFHFKRQKGCHVFENYTFKTERSL